MATSKKPLTMMEKVERYLVQHKRIAVGDAENDITMLETAGIGAVMKNADDNMKKYGNYITEHDNNEGGVAEVIQKFMLNP